MEISFDYSHELVTYWHTDRISMKRSHVADPIPRATIQAENKVRARKHHTGYLMYQQCVIHMS